MRICVISMLLILITMKNDRGLNLPYNDVMDLGRMLSEESKSFELLSDKVDAYFVIKIMECVVCFVSVNLTTEL